MKLLITGKGTSGSWAIRGVQLGQAIGATAVLPQATKVDGYDMAVLVKRSTPALLAALHGSRARLIWDIVDAWPQPEGNAWPKERCMAWLREQVAIVRPFAIVAATEAMAADCQEFGVPVLALPHHARPALDRNPIRETVRKVAYDGSDRQLGDRWIADLQSLCSNRGWQWVMNPRRLVDVDILVALRALHGYAAVNWKSNVKLANAQATGTPIVCGREAGYLETKSGGEQWADTAEELGVRLDALTPYDVRLEASQRMFAAAPRLVPIANGYRQWLEELWRS